MRKGLKVCKVVKFVKLKVGKLEHGGIINKYALLALLRGGRIWDRVWLSKYTATSFVF